MRISSYTRGHGFLENHLSRRRAARADALLPDRLRSGTVLDIGCGQYPFFLLQSRFAVKIGLESPDTPPGPRESSVRFIRQDLEKEAALPVESGTLEAVTLLAVMEHLSLDTVAVLLKEIRRVLKDGGVCVATTPVPTADTLLRLMARLGLVSAAEIRTHRNAFSRKTLCRLFIAAGFHPGKILSGRFELGLNSFIRAEK